MEAGSSMFYPMQVVDGRVHALGGSTLREACERLPEVSPGVKCPIGEAVITDATEGLKDFFEHIVHAAPPMYTSTDWEHKLSRCWKAALEKAWSLGLGTSLKVASPLLGAGACGAPVEEAAQVAARAFVKWAATPVGGVLSLVRKLSFIVPYLQNESIEYIQCAATKIRNRDRSTVQTLPDL
ncbi:unnamed protein product [Durusdinium trenchii]|uniref:Macro domain-containing protein n=1 Tax=Durusdinium trenchii TaxID=1381693 RepID=A0ABP0SU30_9DINO